ncbi:MAG: hypothetical protein M3081_15295 [Gemmatimonadota bacterium]|nr:hypothetical protein [Gemmatimonadota bacterium]
MTSHTETGDTVNEIRLRVPLALLRETFAELRRCGAGRRECQMLWTGPWSDPSTVTTVVHPVHRARGDGFELDSDWLTMFWRELARTRCGVRAQIHTHPREAFHSRTDDAFPIVHTPGFLSLVVPHFATRDVGLRDAYLAEIEVDGTWRSFDPTARLEVTND